MNHKKSKKCYKCIYRASTQVPWQCEYILIEGHMRNCEPGDKCTKYKSGERKALDNTIQLGVKTNDVESYLDFLTTTRK